MAVLVWACRLDEKNVRILGNVPASLPPFQVPHLRWELVQKLTGSSLALAVLGLLEAPAMAKAIAARTGQKLDMHQQCLSEGIANVTGSFFQCIPGSGSLTRSAVNQHAGGRQPVVRCDFRWGRGGNGIPVRTFGPLHPAGVAGRTSSGHCLEHGRSPAGLLSSPSYAL